MLLIVIPLLFKVNLVILEFICMHDHLLVYFKLSRFVVVLNPIDKSPQKRQRQDKKLTFYFNFFSEIVKTLNLINGTSQKNVKKSKTLTERERKLSYWN